MCRLPWNLGASTSWNLQGLSRPVHGLLYLLPWLPSLLMFLLIFGVPFLPLLLLFLRLPFLPRWPRLPRLPLLLDCCTYENWLAVFRSLDISCLNLTRSYGLVKTVHSVSCTASSVKKNKNKYYRRKKQLHCSNTVDCHREIRQNIRHKAVI